MLIAEKWTNTSGPFSCSMKPYPLESSNHFTLPVAIVCSLLSFFISTATYTTDYITDGSPERIFKGAFEEIEDHSPSPCYLNPGDTTLVQKATFKDKDANKLGIQVTKVLVKNVENADDNDVQNVQVKVTGMVEGEEKTYTAEKAPAADDWGSGAAMEFKADEFSDNLPPTFDDEGTVTVEIKVTIGGTVDKHKIQTLVTLIAVENGETYGQSIQASTIPPSGGVTKVTVSKPCG